MPSAGRVTTTFQNIGFMAAVSSNSFPEFSKPGNKVAVSLSNTNNVNRNFNLYQ